MAKIRANQNRSKYEPIVIVCCAMVAAVIAAAYFYYLGAPKEVSIVILTGVFSIAAALLPKFLEHKKSKENDSTLLESYHFSSPVVVSLRAFFLLILSKAALGLYNFVFFFVVRGYYEPLDRIENWRFAAEIGTLYQLTLLPFTIAISKYSAHRIERHKAKWIIGTLALVNIPIIAVGLFVAPTELRDMNAITFTLGNFGLHVIAAVVGIVWARKTQDEFLVRDNFRRLAKSDRKRFLDLLRTSPRRWKVTKRPYRT